jgi:CheY-like chemotaxis protein
MGTHWRWRVFQPRLDNRGTGVVVHLNLSDHNQLGSDPEPLGERFQRITERLSAVVRSGLRMLLDAEPEFEVVAEAGELDSAIRYVRGHKPSVLVLDLNMPGEPSLPAQQTHVAVQEGLVSEDTDALNDLYVASAPSRACRLDKPGKRPKKCGF